MKNDYLPKEQNESYLKHYNAIGLSPNPIVEYLLDSKDSLSVQYFKHCQKVCDYTKIPYNFKTITKFNSTGKIEKTTRVLVINNTKSIATKNISKLITFVANGGTVLFPALIEDQRFLFFLGVKEDANLDYDVHSKGIYFDTKGLVGSSNKHLFKLEEHFSYERNNFSDKVKVHIWSDSNKSLPVVLENKIGNGKVIYFNTSKPFDKKDRGFLFTGILKGISGIPYPVANTSTIFLDDFPSPLYYAKKEPIKSEYNINMNDYVYRVWWLDMKKLSKKYDIKYTAMLTFDYDAIQNAPFSFKQWDNAKIKLGKNKTKITANALSNDLLKDKHELGFHGYNHISLLKEEWKNPTQIELSMKAAKKKWLVNNFKEFPVTYVPPSNYIDEYGISILKNNMSSLKYMCSLYSGETKEGCNREFDFEPNHKNMFDYPRISSGFNLHDRNLYDVYSTFLYTGIFTHFVHPDDVYQIRNNVEKQKKKYQYELRNEFGLFWKKKKNSLFRNFDSFLSNYKKNYPQTDFYTAKDAVPIVMNWRASNFEHSFVNNIYKVEEKTNFFQKTGNTWFVYFDTVTPEILNQINSQSKDYSVNDFLDGKLFFLKSKNHLSFSHPKNEMNLEGNVLKEYEKYIFNRFKYISGSNEITQQDFLEKIEDEKKKLLELILNEPNIDYKVWNKYATYMSWKDKGDEVWELLDKHCQKYEIKHNINYSFELAKILGYSSEDLQKKWIKKQFKWNQDDLKVLKEYLSIIITTSEYDEIGEVLNKILKLEPICENEEVYINHLLLYDNEKAFAELSLVNPSTANYSDNLVSDICWSYVNVKEDYQSAINWAEYSDLIGFDTKLSWMFELKQYIELENEYKAFIMKNPNDDAVRYKMFQIYESLGKYDEACNEAIQVKESEILNQIKVDLSEQIIYLDPDIQEFLIKKYPTLFDSEVVEKIKYKLKLLYGDYIESNSTLGYFVKEKQIFQNHIKYGHFDKKKNEHIFSLKQKELFDIDIVNIQERTNIFEMAYDFKSKANSKRKNFMYKYGLGLEKDIAGKFYFNSTIGCSINTYKNSLSANLELTPANFYRAYIENVYQPRAVVYYNRKFKFFEWESFVEANYFTKIDVFNPGIDSKFKVPINKNSKFKILPFVEGYYQFSTINEEVVISPVYLIKSRNYGGIGLEANAGDDYDKFSMTSSGGYYLDSFDVDFVSLTANFHYRFLKYVSVKGGVDLNFQSRYFSNTFNLGFKYIF